MNPISEGKNKYFFINVIFKKILPVGVFSQLDFFFWQDWRSIAGLHYLLCSNNGSLQALRIPMSDSRGDSLCLPALPSTLRSLHITGGTPYSISATEVQKRDRIDELLELAASCCPQLAMLMLPILFNIYMPSLSKLVRFEKWAFLINRIIFFPKLCLSKFFDSAYFSCFRPIKISIFYWATVDRSIFEHYDLFFEHFNLFARCIKWLLKPALILIHIFL